MVIWPWPFQRQLKRSKQQNGYPESTLTTSKFDAVLAENGHLHEDLHGGYGMTEDERRMQNSSVSGLRQFLEKQARSDLMEDAHDARGEEPVIDSGRGEDGVFIDATNFVVARGVMARNASAAGGSGTKKTNIKPLASRHRASASPPEGRLVGRSGTWGRPLAGAR